MIRRPPVRSLTGGRILLFVREYKLGTVMCKLLCESSRLTKLTGFQSIEVFVGFQLALRNLHHVHSHIGAV